jgi:hypothetical protein
MRIQDILTGRNQWIQGKPMSVLSDGTYQMCLGTAVIRHGAKNPNKEIGLSYVMNGLCYGSELRALQMMAQVIRELFPERTECSYCVVCYSLYGHRFRIELGALHNVENFNDHPGTTFDQVEKVMEEYQRRVDEQF